MYHILGLPEQKMPFTFYCDLNADLPHFPHRCQTFPSMPRNMIRWWQRRNRPWQHMAPFQENRFRHNIHVEAMKFIRPREDLKHRRTIRAQIIPSREYVMTGLGNFFPLALCTRPKEPTQSGGEICLPNVYTKLTPSAYPISEKSEETPSS